MSERTVRTLVRQRSGGLCEMCSRPATNMHHRRRAGRVWAASNILHLCGSGTTGCHGKVTNTNGHRPEYERRGWIVPSWANPTTTPVHIQTGFGWGWYLLDDEGNRVSCSIT